MRSAESAKQTSTMALAEAVEANFVAVECLQDIKEEEAIQRCNEGLMALALSAPSEWVQVLQQWQMQFVQAPAVMAAAAIAAVPALPVVAGVGPPQLVRNNAIQNRRQVVGGGGTDMARVISPDNSRCSTPVPPDSESEGGETNQAAAPLPPLRVAFIPQLHQAVAFHRAFVVRCVPTDVYNYPVPLNNDEDTFTLFTRGFEFDLDDEPVPNPGAWLQCISTLPIVLSYNGGLGHHIVAVQESTSTIGYATALQCYNQAMLRIHEQLATLQYDDELDMLRMALFNNMAHCLAKLGDMQQAKAYLHQLRVAFTTLCSQRPQLLREEDMPFFKRRLALGHSLLFPAATM